MRELLNKLKETRKDYRSMIDYCCDSLIMNNYIVRELDKHDIFSEVYCGNYISYYDENGNEITEEEYYNAEDNTNYEESYDDIYQYYIIDSLSAERLKDFTNELIIYYEDLDLYLLCVKHLGTAWHGVPANWKDEYIEEE